MRQQKWEEPGFLPLLENAGRHYFPVSCQDFGVCEARAARKVKVFLKVVITMWGGGGEGEFVFLMIVGQNEELKKKIKCCPLTGLWPVSKQ